MNLAKIKLGIKRLASIDLEVWNYYSRVYVGEGWKLIVRNRFLSAFMSLTILSLLTMGYSLIVLNAHLNQVLTQANRNLIVTVTLGQTTHAVPIEQAIYRIRSVKKVVYLSQKEVRAQFLQNTKFPTASAPNVNIFPQILEVHTSNASSIGRVSGQINKVSGVQQTSYLKDLIQSITGTTNGLRTMALFTLIFLGILTLGLLMAIVRVTVYAKKKSVQIMSLVGASRTSITFPLLAQVGIITLTMGTLACVFGWALDPALGVNSPFISSSQHLPVWLHTGRAYGLFQLWPVIVPGFLLITSLVVIQSVRQYAND